MITLAIDSTAVAASVAVVDSDKILAEYTVNTALTHSETLLPMIKAVLSSAKLTVKDVELFALTVGPGSFTGVRIGVSVIKGLCFGTNKPIVSVSTLEALARNLEGFEGIICPLMDARRNQLYNALFKNGKRLTPDRLISAQDLEKELANYSEPVYFTGDGYNLAHSLIKAENIKHTPVRLRLQNAVAVAITAQESYKANENIFTDASIAPIYLRPSQAERERKEKEKCQKE